jgi:flagellar motor switch protein FliN
MSEADNEIVDDLLAGNGEENEAGSAADDWAAALEEQQRAAGTLQDARTPEAQLATFEGFENDPLPAAAGGGVEKRAEDINLDVILDVPVTLSMEIGRTRINIRNLLQLSEGSVVELDRLAGEPMDVFVNGTLIAHGEVVVVNDKFGIRMTDVISPAERVRKLK